MLLNNRKDFKAIRKKLRNNATPQEIILWSRLRGRRLGYKFKRQSGVGSYIVDFYCPERRLAIEIDGSQHIESDIDERRTDFLHSLGIKVLRFWNREIDTNLEGVLTQIATTLDPSLERREGEE